MGSGFHPALDPPRRGEVSVFYRAEGSARRMHCRWSRQSLPTAGFSACWLERYPGAVQLQQVVRCTVQLPRRGHLVQPPQQKLSQPSSVFDLPEHRLHRLFSLAVPFSILGLRQPVAHPLGNGGILCRTSRAGGERAKLGRRQRHCHPWGEARPSVVRSARAASSLLALTRTHPSTSTSCASARVGQGKRIGECKCAGQAATSSRSAA